MIFLEKVTKNNGTLIVAPINQETAKKIIVNNHYSRTWNTSFGSVNYGIYRDGEILGVAVFGNLMNPASYKKITHLPKGSVLELNRLWVDDKLVKNAETVFLSLCFKLIKSNYPEVKFIQSFADGRLGCGTIYKAANFGYYGYHKTHFLRNKATDEVYHFAPFTNTKRMNSMLSLCRQYLDGQLESMEVKTYRYIYSLYRDLKCNLKAQPYPSYDIGYTIASADIFSSAHIARLHLLYNDAYSEKAYDLGVSLFGDKFIADIDAQKKILNIDRVANLEEFLK